MEKREIGSAPSNIALIKYMGKGASQTPLNDSLSLTLPQLRTFVEVEERVRGEKSDAWEPLVGSVSDEVLGGLDGDFHFGHLNKLSLSETSQSRFLSHLKFLKKAFQNEDRFFVIRSGNSFPSDSGLASSASSFAALTFSFYRWLRNRDLAEENTLEQLAQLSRMGSGSSCRSFFSPACVWSSEGVREENVGDLNLKLVVFVTEDKKKEVSSSRAHERVLTSLLFSGRPDRAQKRMQDLIHVLRVGKWNQAYEICWAEFWDMHCLFETSAPSFGYMTEGSLACLREVRRCWAENTDGPIVTMDAGPNVHLIFRRDQEKILAQLKKSLEVKGTWLESGSLNTERRAEVNR